RDLGHELSVRVSCVSTSMESTSAPTATVANGEPEKPVIGTLDGPQSRNSPSTTASSIGGRSGVALDPTGTRLPFHVAQLGPDGRLVDPSQLTLSATAVNNFDGVPRDPATVLGPEDIE